MFNTLKTFLLNRWNQSPALMQYSANAQLRSGKYDNKLQQLEIRPAIGTCSLHL